MNFSSYIEENIREEIENHKEHFQMVTPEFVNIYFLYVINNQCDEYVKEVVPLKQGVLTKESLLAEIVKKRNDGRRFNISGVYSYNFNVDDLATFVERGDKGFTQHTEVDAIHFNQSVDYFQHHISLFIFLTNEKNKHTKKTNIVPRRKTLKSV
jgi:uncharacterized protein YegJ (DUF2314 family)